MTEQFKDLVIHYSDNKSAEKAGTCRTEDKYIVGEQTMEPLPDTEASDPSATDILSLPEDGVYAVKIQMNRSYVP